MTVIIIVTLSTRTRELEVCGIMTVIIAATVNQDPEVIYERL